ncbi:hypothetical protein B0H14DRAFT_3521993 [Mycena olivaceomarginata]|nr:hypothetical protein B0H14DRAFT_3521993 [Mycena olivaceomarginata]
MFDLRALVDGTMYTDMRNTYFAMNLDVVVNNPGINMTGRTRTPITACAPVMLKQKSGVFIHVSSVGALCPAQIGIVGVPRPDSPTDCATKAAIIAISKSIAIEYAPMQLNLGPGVEATPENIAPMLANISMSRACEPSDVASTVAFLASDDACYLTGNVVEVDGGPIYEQTPKLWKPVHPGKQC